MTPFLTIAPVCGSSWLGFRYSFARQAVCGVVVCWSTIAGPDPACKACWLLMMYHTSLVIATLPSSPQQAPLLLAFGCRLKAASDVLWMRRCRTSEESCLFRQQTRRPSTGADNHCVYRAASRLWVCEPESRSAVQSTVKNNNANHFVMDGPMNGWTDEQTG